jgi:hypothetical protein
MYKKTFASEGNEDITIGLIHDFFGFKPEKLTLKTPYDIDSYSALVESERITELRRRIKDVSASMATSDFIGEMQLKKLRFWDERFFLYLRDQYRSNYSEAEKMVKMAADAEEKGAAPRVNRHSSLKPVYQLTILGENHYPDAYPLRIFEPYYTKRKLKHLKQPYKQAFFELEKGKSKLDAANQKHWHDYFVRGEVSAEAPVYIQKATGLLTVANLSEKEREVMSLVERAVADYEADMADAQHENSCRIARNMLAKNYSVDDIHELTGLDMDTIEELSAQPV